MLIVIFKNLSAWLVFIKGYLDDKIGEIQTFLV